MKSHFLPFLITICATGILVSETVKDREGSIRQDRANLETGTRWKYNDLESGLAEARRTGKPLLVTLRCVPCLACAGIDTQVLLESDELGEILDQFVCVRLINANALDLSLFQFDYDLSYSVLFFNGDGTIYGRFGSWTHQKDAQEKSTRSFQIAMEEALRLHKNYPANKASLAGKQGRSLPYKTPADMPSLSGKYTPQLSWDTKLVQSCIHCHQVGDAIRKEFREKDGTIPSKWVYPYPTPDTIGLVLADDRIAKVDAVKSNSPAAKAGFQTGDHITRLNGQPLISTADISWILHQIEEDPTLTAEIDRTGSKHQLTLTLPSDWRMQSDISRRVGTWPLRAMAFGGMRLIDLTDAEREERGLNKDKLALYAMHVGQYGDHALAKRAGFIKEDVIVEFGGISHRMSEGEMIGHLIRNYKPGDRVKATVLRGDQELTMEFKAQ